jgi:hypothetical protein
MTYNIDEIKDLQGAPLQQKGQEIKQRFDFRRNFYHNLRNNIFNTEDRCSSAGASNKSRQTKIAHALAKSFQGFKHKLFCLSGCLVCHVFC